MVAIHFKKIKHSILCVTGVYLKDVTKKVIHFLQFCSLVWLWVIWAFAHLVTILCFAVVFLLLCLSCASLKFRSSSKQVQERYSFKVWRAGCLLQNRFREDISKSFWRQVFIFFFSDVFQFTSHQLTSQWGLTYWRNILYPLVTHQPCESLNMMHLSPWGADMLLFLLVLQFWWMFFVFELNKSCQILLCFQKSLEVSGFVSWLAQKLWVLLWSVFCLLLRWLSEEAKTQMLQFSQIL